MGIARDLTGNYQRGLLLCTIPCLVNIAIMAVDAPAHTCAIPA
jgi:hypothetical protein